MREELHREKNSSIKKVHTRLIKLRRNDSGLLFFDDLDEPISNLAVLIFDPDLVSKTSLVGGNSCAAHAHSSAAINTRLELY
jgi:hypothetical protein